MAVRFPAPLCRLHRCLQLLPLSSPSPSTTNVRLLSHGHGRDGASDAHRKPCPTARCCLDARTCTFGAVEGRQRAAQSATERARSSHRRQDRDRPAQCPLLRCSGPLLPLGLGGIDPQPPRTWWEDVVTDKRHRRGQTRLRRRDDLRRMWSHSPSAAGLLRRRGASISAPGAQSARGPDRSPSPEAGVSLAKYSPLNA